MSTPSRNSPPARRVLERFAAEFGPAPPRLFWAPGRVNLIGEHLDYNGGDVLPIAVDRGLYAAVRRTGDGMLRLRSLDREAPVDRAVRGIGARAAPEDGWASYAVGVWRGMKASAAAAGLQAVFGGDLPIASGLSSSAALEVVVATALDALLETKLDPVERAQVCHRAERDYVGVRCGIMDQYACALGRPGHALWLRCADASFEHIALAGAAFEVLVMDTGKPRELADSRYNQRVDECAQARAALAGLGRQRPHLAACDRDDLAAAEHVLPPVLLRRLRHVVREMERVREAVRALRAADLGALGAAVDGSHFSGRDDYQVSCPELDGITACAREVDGVLGARFVGAGFGGCAIALVRPGCSAAVIEHVGPRYRMRFGIEAAFAVLGSGCGPVEVDV